MSTSNTPTSPAVRPTQEAASRRYPVSWFVANLLVALIAGLAGALVVQSYPLDWPAARWIRFSIQPEGDTPGVVFVQRGLQTDSSELVDLLRAHQTKTVVSVFSADETVFSADRALGQGIIVSSDGWIVLLSAVLDGDDVARSTVSIALNDGHVLQSETVLNDEVSGLSFARVATTQLPTADFRTSPVQAGEVAISYADSIASGDRFSFSHVENTSFNESGVFSTQRVNTRYLIDQASRPEYLGGPVFDEQGQMIGLNLLDHQVLPISAVSQLLYPIFSQAVIQRHAIDLEYTPLGIPESIAEKFSGAKITAVNGSASQLKVGDIVTAVDEVPIDTEHDLADVLNDIEFGRTVEIQIIRNKKELTVQVLVR